MFKTRDVRPGSWSYPHDSHTLCDLKRNRILLVVCQRCKHEGRLYPADYIERFGDKCPAVHLRRFLRCSPAALRWPTSTRRRDSLGLHRLRFRGVKDARPLGEVVLRPKWPALELA
jgi:hypothetical protein